MIINKIETCGTKCKECECCLEYLKVKDDWLV